jgi:hypothetical protein
LLSLSNADDRVAATDAYCLLRPRQAVHPAANRAPLERNSSHA